MKPKLRSLEIIPFSAGGDEFLLLRDRLGLAEDASIPRELAPIVGLFDGTRDIARIIASYERRGGETLPIWFVQRIVDQLDEALLLDSPRFAAHRRQVMGEFDRALARPATHAGASYPDDPDELRALLGSFFQSAAQLPVAAPVYQPLQLRGVVVPHIDFTRGGPVEALAYEALRDQQFDTFIVLGIAHSGVRYPFCVAPKDYETPLGTVPADREFITALQSRLDDRLTHEQFAHKNEHSVEFVAVFLQYLQSTRKARMVPILCGGFHEETHSGTSPGDNPDIAAFCRALREVTEEREKQGERIGIIASVDLTHAGSRFGDDTRLTPTTLASIRKEDRAFLACAERGDREALHAHIARDDNARNVDAHPALYTALAAFPHLRAQFLHYDQAFDAAANSVVSFASMTLYQT